MRILVTGSSGFLGQNLCRRLCDEGHEVVGVDVYSPIYDSVGPQDVNYVEVNHDVTSMPSSSLWNSSISDLHLWKFHQIYHLACNASPLKYQSQPLQTMLTNVVGTSNVLSLARESDARVLLTGTSEVYGDPEVSPQSESYRGNVNCTGPRACYDEGKRAAECLMFDAKRQYDQDIVVARIFNTYGPGMPASDGRVVSNFISQALAGKPLTIYGGGSQTRSFMYVDDCIEGLVRLMNSKETGPINLGNPRECCSVMQLAIAVERNVNPEGDTCARAWCDLPIDDPQRRLPDISLAKERLGWEPEVSLQEGLSKTVAWFRETSNVS